MEIRTTGYGEPNVVMIEIQYPRVEGNQDTIEVGLEDVRAASSLRIKYDFDRDGWVVFREDEVNKTTGEDAWIEKAFIAAWSDQEK